MGNGGTLLASSSKDNTRVELIEVEMDSKVRLRIDKLYFYLLASGTDEYWVCQELPACSSTSNPDVCDYKGRTRLSPPAAYPSTVGNEANERSL